MTTWTAIPIPNQQVDLQAESTADLLTEDGITIILSSGVWTDDTTPSTLWTARTIPAMA